MISFLCIFLGFLSDGFLNYDIFDVKVFFQLQLIELFFTFKLDLRYKDVLNIDDYCLVTLVDRVLLELVLKLLECMEFFHPLSKIDCILKPH